MWLKIMMILIKYNEKGIKTFERCFFVTIVVLTFSGDIEMEHWAKMD